jgi:hypothetical protein
MNESARAAKLAYMKKWRQNNRDKVRASQERYWLKKAAEAEEQAKKADIALSLSK